MPAALNVNREAVKTLAMAIGVREAARQMNLPENTVMQWSARYNWFAEPKLPPTMKRVSSESTSPGDIMKQVGERSRFSLDIAGEKAAKHLEKLGGHEIVSKATKFKEIVAATSQLHGFDAKDQAGSFSLNVLSLGDLNVEIGKRD
jgi:hypothetical protein